MNGEAVVLINAFEVPIGEDEAFLRGWEHARGFLMTQPGYRSTQLHQSLTPDAEFRYVNVAEWDSAQEFQAAVTRPEFRAAAIPYRFHASLYRVVRGDHRRDPKSAEQTAASRA